MSDIPKNFEYFDEKSLKVPGKNTAFIKGGTIDPNQKKIVIDEKDQGQLYIPQKMEQEQLQIQKQMASQLVGFTDMRSDSNRQKNIDIYFSKLKQRSDEKQKQILSKHSKLGKSQRDDLASKDSEKTSDSENMQILFHNIKKHISHSFSDINGKTIAVFELKPDQDEDFLRKEFSRFGQIMKISRKCFYTPDDFTAMANIIGFVQFSGQEDVKKAIEANNKKQLEKVYKIRIGKALDIDYSSQSDDYSQKESTQNLNSKQRTVEIPENSIVRKMIDKLAKLVVNEGYQIEKYLIEREYSNNEYGFLFVKNCLENNYYKWRIYSLLQGDEEKKWNDDPFMMTTTGLIWYPPLLDDYEAKSSTFVREKDSKKQAVGTKQLSLQLRDELDDLLRNITLTKYSIGEVMMFCLDHSEYSATISLIITQSIEEAEDKLNTLLARLYLISDIFHNCSITSIPEKNLWSYRQYFEWHLPYIFEVINRAQAYAVKNEGLKGDVFKEKIMRLLQIWNDWAIFDYHYIFGLEAIYNCEENAFVQSQDSVRLNYNPQTPLGLKLKCYEDKLFEQSIEQIERTCHSNGQSAMGSKEDMIARLMLVEKYKLLKENKDLADEDYDKRLPQAPLSKPELLKLLQKFDKILYKTNQDASISDMNEYVKEGLTLLKNIQRRNQAINSYKIDGEELDEVDVQLYNIKDQDDTKKFHMETISLTVEQPDIEGQPLTEEEIRKIQEGKISVVSYHDINYLFRNQNSGATALKKNSTTIEPEELADAGKTKQAVPHLSPNKVSDSKSNKSNFGAAGAPDSNLLKLPLSSKNNKESSKFGGFKENEPLQNKSSQKKSGSRSKSRSGSYSSSRSSSRSSSNGNKARKVSKHKSSSSRSQPKSKNYRKRSGSSSSSRSSHSGSGSNSRSRSGSRSNSHSNTRSRPRSSRSKNSDNKKKTQSQQRKKSRSKSNPKQQKRPTGQKKY